MLYCSICDLITSCALHSRNRPKQWENILFFSRTTTSLYPGILYRVRGNPYSASSSCSSPEPQLSLYYYCIPLPGYYVPCPRESKGTKSEDIQITINTVAVLIYSYIPSSYNNDMLRLILKTHLNSLYVQSTHLYIQSTW